MRWWTVIPGRELGGDLNWTDGLISTTCRADLIVKAGIPAFGVGSHAVRLD